MATPPLDSPSRVNERDNIGGGAGLVNAHGEAGAALLLRRQEHPAVEGHALEPADPSTCRNPLATPSSAPGPAAGNHARVSSAPASGP